MYTTRSSTKQMADMAEQPMVPSQLEDMEDAEDAEDVEDAEYVEYVEDAEDAEEDAPSVTLSKLMDVMTRRLERLLAEQDKCDVGAGPSASANRGYSRLGKSLSPDVIWPPPSHDSTFKH